MKQTLFNWIKSLIQWGSMAAVLGFVCTMTPQLHSYYLRSTVGEKTVKLTNNRRGGTGFHVEVPSGKTYILTNAHICLLADKNDQIKVESDYSTYSLKRKVIARSRNHDLCLVEGLPGVSGIDLSSYATSGQLAALIGHPKLRPLTLSRGELIGTREIRLLFGINLPSKMCIGDTYNVGVVNAQTIRSLEIPYRHSNIYEILKSLPRKVLRNPIALQKVLTSLRIETICIATLQSTMLNGISYPGNSGSPVVNFYGNLVGVLFAGSRDVTDAYLVPLYYARDFLRNY